MAVGLAACGSSSDSDAGGDYEPQVEHLGQSGDSDDSGADAAVAEEGAAVDTAGSADVDGSLVTADGVDRVVITTGSVTVLADEPTAAAEDVRALADSHDARIDNHHQSTEGRDPWVSLVVRMDPADVDAFVEELGNVGEVAEIAIDAEDVTGTVRDLDAEISALEASVTRLEGLMAEAGSVADLLAAETELTSRQGELDQLRAQRTDLGEQAALSTLTVTVTTPDSDRNVEPQSGWSRMWHDAGDAFTGAIRGVVVAVAALAPLILLLGIVAALVVPAVRRRRARNAGRPGPAGAPAGSNGPDASRPGDHPSSSDQPSSGD
jgi:hypothetical protein